MQTIERETEGRSRQANQEMLEETANQVSFAIGRWWNTARKFSPPAMTPARKTTRKKKVEKKQMKKMRKGQEEDAEGKTPQREEKTETATR